MITRLLTGQQKVGLIRFVALCITTAALTFTSTAWSQDSKVRVSVSHIGEDQIGKQFAYAVREAVRGSNGFRLTPGVESVVQINIVSVNPERSSSAGGNWTAAAVIYTMQNFNPFDKGNPQTWYRIYLTTVVMTIGVQRVDQQAKSALATLDEALEQYRRDTKN